MAAKITASTTQETMSQLLSNTSRMIPCKSSMESAGEDSCGGAKSSGSGFGINQVGLLQFLKNSFSHGNNIIRQYFKRFFLLVLGHFSGIQIINFGGPVFGAAHRHLGWRPQTGVPSRHGDGFQ